MNPLLIVENLSNKEERSLRVRGILFGLIPIIIMGLILFGSAGTVYWPMAWIILISLFMATMLVTLICKPELINERMNKHTEAKDWDIRLVRIMNLIGLLTLFVAGLDKRFGWTGGISFPLFVITLGFFIFGYFFFSWAMVTNQFFSQVVRIQDENGHHPITTGPYRFVRHPGYLGFIFIVLAQPLVLGSLWALLPAVITVVLFIARTSKEDGVLLSELPGYRTYAQKTRYRLIPCVW